MAKVDIDKVELLAKAIKKAVAVGEDIMEDGKVDLSDLAKLGDLGSAMKDLVDAAKAFDEIKEEIKDIDAAEGIKIVGILLG